MNAKFFGDSKDLFKYDLITAILKNFHGKIDRLVIVPMLTDYYPRFKGTPGCRNKNLIECFRRFRTKEDVDNYYLTLKEYFKDLKAVLPNPIIAVGGINIQNIEDYLRTVTGVGIGTSLYSPNKSYDEIHHSAAEFIKRIAKNTELD